MTSISQIMMYGITFILTVAFLLLIEWYTKKEFKDGTHKNKTLLEFEYKDFTKVALHQQILAITLIIGGVSFLSNQNSNVKLVGLVFLTAGAVFGYLSIMYFYQSRRRKHFFYKFLQKENPLKKEIKSSKKHTKKIVKKRTKIKNKAGIYFLVFIVILGLFSIFWLSKIDDYIPPSKYAFEIQGHEIDTIRDVKIFHDFSENIGAISFQIEKENYIGNEPTIDIELPSKIDNKTLVIYRQEENKNSIVNNWITRENEHVNKEKYTQILIKDIPLFKSEEVNYIIKYELEILPSGHFTFHHPGTNLYGFSPTVALDLGKDYECTKNCIESMKYVTYDYLNSDKEIRLELERTEQDYNFHSFILTGARDIRIQQGVAIGLVVSIFMSILISIKDILEKRKID
jgi:hypothetical protein